MSDAEIQTIPRESSPASSVFALIQQAMHEKADPAYLRELLAVRQAWEADEARKNYNRSIAEFQRRAPIVPKDDDAYGKSYAKLDRIWRTIRPLVTELGLSVTWQISELREGKLCHVEGQLRHRDGHGERLIQDIPLPELIKGQNIAQQMGSAMTYARRYAICSALGVVTGEDDDGTAAGAQFVTFDQAREITDLLEACRGLSDFNEGKFWEWAGAGLPAEIARGRYEDVQKLLKRKLGKK